MTQPSGNDLDAVRRILFGADVARVEQAMEEMKTALGTRASEFEGRTSSALQELERRTQQRTEEVAQRVTTQLEELSRRQQAHAEKVTQLLDQVMAELSRRTDLLQAETRAGLDELKAKAADLDRRKLNTADFGGTLAKLGQQFAAEGEAPK